MSAPTTRELYDRYVIPTYARFDLQFARGRGSEVWDEDGKRYLDFGAGIAVTSIGHCHPRVVAAMQRADRHAGAHLESLLHAPAGGARRAARAADCAPARRAGKVFFCNSGAEANEALYKLARKFGNEGAPPAAEAHRRRNDRRLRLPHTASSRCTVPFTAARSRASRRPGRRR